MPLQSRSKCVRCGPHTATRSGPRHLRAQLIGFKRLRRPRTARGQPGRYRRLEVAQAFIEQFEFVQLPLSVIEIDPSERGFQANIPRLHLHPGFGDANISARPRGACAAFGRIDKLLAHANRRHREIITIEATGVWPRYWKIPDADVQCWIRQPVSRNRRRLRSGYACLAALQTRSLALRALKRSVERQRLGVKRCGQQQQRRANKIAHEISPIYRESRTGPPRPTLEGQTGT